MGIDWDISLRIEDILMGEVGPDALRADAHVRRTDRGGTITAIVSASGRLSERAMDPP